MLTYEDFSIKIEPRRGTEYPVIVLRSPAGEGRSVFQLPFDPSRLDAVLLDLGHAVRRSGAPSPAMAELTPINPQQVGDELFSALFSGPVRSLLDRSLGMIHGQQKGLRIKIHIDPEDPTLAPLASFPWEFIYRSDTREYFNLSRFTPVVRYLDVQRPCSPLPLKPPLRILVIISAPTDYPGLDLEREKELVRQTWAQKVEVEVDFVEDATLSTLQDRLADETWHVLHYMGHGAFEETTGRGTLVLEDAQANGVLVDGATLGILLRDVPSLRLVFLNACDTARVGRLQGLDPFAGVASAMVLAGVPAVVAMQFPISDAAAIQFTQRFYPLLARGYPVDTAVAEGRRSVRMANHDTLEWGTPVLYMRSPNGEIFHVRSEQGDTADGLPEHDAEERLDAELELLYAAGLQAFRQEDWDLAVEQFASVAAKRSDYREVGYRLEESSRQRDLRQGLERDESTDQQQEPSEGHVPPPYQPTDDPGRSEPPKRGRALWLLAALAMAAVAIAVIIALGGGGFRGTGIVMETETSAFRGIQDSTDIVIAPTTPAPDRSPAVTATSTARSEPSLRPRFVTNQPVRTYTGPGTDYPPGRTTRAGDMFEVIGRNEAGDWLRLCCVEGEAVWIESLLGALEGSLDRVAIAQVSPPPATPTGAPTPAVETIPPQASPTSTAQPLVEPTPTLPARPTNTATRLICGVAVDPALSSSYNANLLGCPAAAAQEIVAAWQPFDGGYMLWRSDTRMITLLSSGRTWAAYRDQWNQQDPTLTRGSPPEGKQAPQRGFGYLWGTEDAAFAQMGWAVDGEKGLCAVVQVFQNGTILHGSAVQSCQGVQNRVEEISLKPFRLILYANGTWQPG